MQTFEGVVSKSAKSQYGYYFFLQNVEGIFTLGKWRAPEQGAHIKFEAEPKASGKGYSAKGSTIVLLDSTPQPVQPSATAAAPTVASKPVAIHAGFDRYRDREFCETEALRITRQSSRNAAVQLVAALVTAGALELPKTKAKAYDAAVNYVTELTDMFYYDAVGKLTTTPPEVPETVDETAPAEKVQDAVTDLDDFKE